MIIAVLAAFVAVPAIAQDAVAPEIKIDVNAYDLNIVRLAPITAMDLGVGFGVSYERIIGKQQMFGIVFPVYMLLENKAGYDVIADRNKTRYNTYVYFAPGLKIYPFGQRRVTYAVGPNLMLGYGGGNEWQSRLDMYGTEHLEDVKTTKLRLGVLVNNYVNFQVSKVFNLGLEGGIGIRYYDKTSYKGSAFYAGNGSVNDGFDITGQFALTLGLRF